jgi:hypothetical protein
MLYSGAKGTIAPKNGRRCRGKRPFVAYVDQAVEEVSNCRRFSLQARSVTEQPEHSYMILDIDQWKQP